MSGWTTTLRIALEALIVNKLRSFLTMLGIIIGVGSVIAMMAVGEGASRQIEEQMASMGSNLLMVVPGSTTTSGLRMGMGSQSNLTLEDAEAIAEQCPSVQEVAPSHNGSAQVVFGNLNWATRITGSTPGILIVRDWAIGSGRSFTATDFQMRVKARYSSTRGSAAPWMDFGSSIRASRTSAT